jgi:hypothetical protein
MSIIIRKMSIIDIFSLTCFQTFFMRNKILFNDYTFFAALIIAFVLQLFQLDDSSSLPLPAISATHSANQLPVNDSLPYSRYRLMLDSVEQINNCRAEQLKSIGSWMLIGWPGFTEINDASICESFPKDDTWNQYKYFLALPGYRLNPNADFYMNNGKYFLKTFVRDTMIGDASTGHFTDKEIAIRFAKPQAQQPGYALIPVSGQKFKTFSIIMYVLAAALALYIIWSLIILPVRVLRAIAKDNAITELNIRDLAIIGWSLVGFALLPGLFTLLIDFIFRNSIPDGINLIFTDTLAWSKPLILAGLILLLLRRAFKKGYIFRKANEITI